ncbi:hypothetical protein GJ496_004481 [Pomphorhynchus laevis]|nr:hypothetical protein GJ496_004481 [Pomphorhynchus laevis]
MDASAWRALLNDFGQSSHRLAESVAKFARQLVTKEIPHQELSYVCLLPFRHGGIGISDPNDMAYMAYRSSLEICGPFMSDTEDECLSLSPDGLIILGAPVGNNAFCAETVKFVVSKLVDHLSKLREIASFEAQLAFSALLKSFQQRWKHIQRCCNCSPSWFKPLMTEMLAFLQELGITCSNDGDPLLAILSTKIRNGGLGLDDPTTTTASEYSASLQIYATYVDSQQCNPDTVMTVACQLLKEQRHLTETERRSSALSRASQNLQSMVVYATMRGASACLSVYPSDQKLLTTNY